MYGIDARSPPTPLSLLWKFLIEIPTRSRAGGAAAKTARPPPRRRARACRSNEDWLAKYWMVIDEAERNEIQLQQTSRGLMRQLRCKIYVLSLRAREHFCHHCEIKIRLVLLSGAELSVRECYPAVHAREQMHGSRQIPCFLVNWMHFLKQLLQPYNWTGCEWTFETWLGWTNLHRRVSLAYGYSWEITSLSFLCFKFKIILDQWSVSFFLSLWEVFSLLANVAQK